jgi:hypothetical protein
MQLPRQFTGFRREGQRPNMTVIESTLERWRSHSARLFGLFESSFPGFARRWIFGAQIRRHAENCVGTVVSGASKAN